MQELQSGDLEDLGHIHLVLEGNSAAFGKLVTKYEKLIYKLAYNFLGKNAEIEDTVQEIFLEIYKSLGNFKLGRKFLPWLYAIALNVLRKKYKHLIRQKQIRESFARAPLPEVNSPEAIVEEKETRRQVRQAIAALPANLREVTLLFYMEDLNVKEICDILGLGTENVKSRLFRARKKLKKMLLDVQLE